LEYTSGFTGSGHPYLRSAQPRHADGDLESWSQWNACCFQAVILNRVNW